MCLLYVEIREGNEKHKEKGDAVRCDLNLFSLGFESIIQFRFFMIKEEPTKFKEIILKKRKSRDLHVVVIAFFFILGRSDDKRGTYFLGKSRSKDRDP